MSAHIIVLYIILLYIVLYVRCVVLAEASSRHSFDEALLYNV